MSRHRFDLSQTFENRQDLPPFQELEDPSVQLEGVLQDNWPTRAVEREPYKAGRELIEAVNLAIASGRPLLLQGDPGCGKTRLAHAVAYELQLPLEECYIKSTTRAQDLLYTYDAVNRLYDAQLGADGPHINGVPQCRHIKNYIRFGPLGRAIIRAQSGRRSVVLIDEIDKADLDFPNDLLLELDRLQFQVAEAPEMRYAVPEDQDKLRPVVFVTHNEEKALPTAFLRRCIFQYVEFPDSEAELLEILAAHDMTHDALNHEAVSVIREFRQRTGYEKLPGLSELLDWVGYMQTLEQEQPELSLKDKVRELPFIGFLFKHQSDQKRARKKIES